VFGSHFGLGVSFYLQCAQKGWPDTTKGFKNVQKIVCIFLKAGLPV
jgi:hypothetical protein